jgi:16S rRNA (cytosine1402-N4)-methyltransferase
MVDEVLAFLRFPNSVANVEASQSLETSDQSTLRKKSAPKIEVIRPDAVFIDATLGTGGHTLAMLRSHPTCRVIAFDRDAHSMSFAFERLQLEGVAERVTMLQGDFRHAEELLQPYLDKQKVAADGLELSHIDGVLIDAGMSLWQVTEPGHGLSFRSDARLDMRYDRSQEVSAHDLVNQLSPSELEDLIFKYADERWARRITAFIVDSRRRNPINTTAELASLIEAAIPIAVRRQSRVHPATKTFAALRLAVNDEFWALDHGARAFCSVLAPAARLVVLTYSSNEDRIIKRTFRSLAEADDDQSTLGYQAARPIRKKRKTEAFSDKSRPSGPARSSLTFSLHMPGENDNPVHPLSIHTRDFQVPGTMRIVTKRPLEPTEQEVAANPLSRSCKLRAIKKVAL